MQQIGAFERNKVIEEIMRAKLILPAFAAGLVVLAGCDFEDLGGISNGITRIFITTTR